MHAWSSSYYIYINACLALTVLGLGINIFTERERESFKLRGVQHTAPELKCHSLGFGENDIIVHLHIQKAGGSYFGALLLDVQYPDAHCLSRKGNLSLQQFQLTGQRLGPKSFICSRGNRKQNAYFQPLFSRFSAGWPCGVHPSYARMIPCALRETNATLQQLKFVTTIRHPVQRFVSEYFQSFNGWSRNDGYSVRNAIQSDFFCNGTLRPPETPCSHGSNPSSDWASTWGILRSVWNRNSSEISTREPSLWDYLACPSTYHHNRQTRMLATEIPSMNSPRDYYNPTFQRLMLDSAKLNLANLAFFGIQERLFESMRLFEWTFGLSYGTIAQNAPKANLATSNFHHKSLELIETHENLDTELYKYGLQVFEQRLAMCGSFCKVQGM